jgi:hypothetical protein
MPDPGFSSEGRLAVNAVMLSRRGSENLIGRPPNFSTFEPISTQMNR